MKKYLSFLHRFSSQTYWDKRYKSGGNSGPGSYGQLAAFKAEVLNDFVIKHGIASVIEFGFGDGNQLTLARYPKYTGYDISTTALKTCQNLFKNDPSKEFFLTSEYDERKASLSISLDVIFHLTEDKVFADYMHRLFDASTQFVIVYSSNQNEPIEPTSIHVKHRQFSRWIEDHAPKWQLFEKIKNPYPYNGDSHATSFADFYIYRKV